MNSALFISAEAPYPLAGGGAMRSASLLELPGAQLCGRPDRIPRAARARSCPGIAAPAWFAICMLWILPPHARHALARDGA